MAATERPRIHLVEVGLAWPPERFIARKLEGLAAAGLRVTVFTAEEDLAPRLQGVEVRRLADTGEAAVRVAPALLREAARLLVRSPRTLLRAVSALWRAKRGGPWDRGPAALRTHLSILLARPDVVHFEWESAAVRLLPLFETCGCPVVVSVRGSGVNVHPHTGQELLAGAYPLVFDRAAAVHCVCEAITHEAQRFGLEPGKARVIRPGVDPAFFSPATRRAKADGFRVLAVGEVNWIKGYDDALAAIALLVAEGVPVSYEVLGGEPGSHSGKASDRGRLLYLAGELGLDGRVRFAGSVDPEAVRERLRSADVLLQSSVSEGLPNSVLEAMACALPVVVTDCGGVREAIEDGNEGVVCPRRDPDALAAALLELWRDPERARRMGEAGRARVSAEFTLERQLQSFTELYEELSGLSPARRL